LLFGVSVELALFKHVQTFTITACRLSDRFWRALSANAIKARKVSSACFDFTGTDAQSFILFQYMNEFYRKEILFNRASHEQQNIRVLR